MKKQFIFIFISIFLISCYRLPQKEEVEYRNRLENALIKTFPKKVTILIHPFENRSPQDTNREYLEEAIPDSIEAMLEPMRSTLAYLPFNGMPFYVSEEISNLFQTVEPDDEDDTNFDDEDDKEEDRDTQSYFSYLTNYLLKIPTQVTQVEHELTTNTNYFKILTNTKFENGQSITNFTSNEILLTKTNKTTTNIVIKDKNLLTTTNMLLLIHEEFPELEEYLSYLPIDIRRASQQETDQYKDYQEKIANPKKWKAKQLAKKKKEEKENNTNNSKIDNNNDDNESKDEDEENSSYPKKDFDYVYHITGDFRTRNRASIEPIKVDIRLKISSPQNYGDDWWLEKYKSKPIKLLDILKLEQTLNTNNLQDYKDLYLRTPYKKPTRSARLQDEFDIISTNFREKKPNIPKNDLKQQNRALSLRVKAKEDQIPFALLNWLKYFHATIINRPYTVIRIDTNPKDTLIYLNGFFIGKTPLIYPTVPIGEQRITFIKDGYNREEILVDILPNQTNSVNFNLRTMEAGGIIKITSSLPSAEVYLNSQYKGLAPLTISNLTLNTKYRVEILNPDANLTSNRNSVYKSFVLTSQKNDIVFDAKFKTYETTYRTAAQKGLLAGTYISWLSTIAILGASVYTQARAKELEALAATEGISVDLKSNYTQESEQFFVASQATLYTAIAGVIISSGIMGWYLYSKEIYLGLDFEQRPQEWYANFKLKF